MHFPSLLLAFLAPAQAIAPGERVALPAPVITGGMPLMDALAARRSTRDFTDAPIPDQVLSDLLWAAWGVNRPDGHRTAPSAMNDQEIDLYLVRADGAWRYDAKDHALVLVTAQDLRREAGHQPFVWKAPLNLVYVADHGRMHKVARDLQDLYAAADAGFIGQNVYLYCASVGLGSVVRAWLDRDALAGRLGLGEDQTVLLSQTVGWPAKPSEAGATPEAP
jgi:nitroreductase